MVITCVARDEHPAIGDPFGAHARAPLSGQCRSSSLASWGHRWKRDRGRNGFRPPALLLSYGESADEHAEMPSSSSDDATEPVSRLSCLSISLKRSEGLS